jgi:hypothetical protein
MSDEPQNPPSEGVGSIEYATPQKKRFSRLSRIARKSGKWGKRIAVWGFRVVLSLTILFGLAVGFGTSGSDAEKMKVFADSADRWQHNPDFRKVQIEYAEQGSEAMRTKVAFIDTTRDILFLRSLPGIPEEDRINDTSLAHYTDFTHGPLTAYMHLTGEQGLKDTLKSIGYLGSKEPLTDDDIRGFLSGYKLPRPVATDAGAVKSVRSLFNDVDASRAFKMEQNVGPLITPHIAAIAKSMGYPTDMNDMNPAEQLAVWQKLDGEIRDTDYELWRTKQVNDWLNGVWAQVYGTMYSGLINPVLKLRETGRVAGPMLLMAWVGFGLWRKKRAGEMGEGAAVAPSPG